VHRRLALVVALGALVAAPAAASVKTPLPGVVTPSGNIKCLFVPGTPSMLLCSIAEAVYTSRLQNRCMNPNGEKGAGVDWHGFELHPTGKGQITCSGGILYNPDTQRPAVVKLAYGKSWRHGAYTCASRITGLTCTTRLGHGLFISRQSWRAW
jgi:hypothetical protein